MPKTEALLAVPGKDDKRIITIMEKDNGYTMSINCGLGMGESYHREFVFTSLASLLKGVSMFLKADLSGEAEEPDDSMMEEED